MAYTPGAAIELGSGASEALVLGDAFQTYFDTQTHFGNAALPTSPPLVLMSETPGLLVGGVKAG